MHLAGGWDAEAAGEVVASARRDVGEGGSVGGAEQAVSDLVEGAVAADADYEVVPVIGGVLDELEGAVWRQAGKREQPRN